MFSLILMGYNGDKFSGLILLFTHTHASTTIREELSIDPMSGGSRCTGISCMKKLFSSGLKQSSIFTVEITQKKKAASGQVERTDWE